MSPRAPEVDADRDAEGGSHRGKREGTAMKILAVENSASAQRLMQAVLLKLGVQLPDLRLASSSTEAIQTFTSWRPDIVFVDLDLSDPSPPRPRPDPPSGDRTPKEMDGDSLARLLLERNPRLNVVVVTAYDADHPRVQSLLASGVRDVIMKPLRAARVQEALTLCARSLGPRAR
jgi:CheY-like chemotaxis protein